MLRRCHSPHSFCQILISSDSVLKCLLTFFMGEQMCTIGERQIINVLGEINDEGVIQQINEVIVRELALDNENLNRGERNVLDNGQQ